MIYKSIYNFYIFLVVIVLFVIPPYTVYFLLFQKHLDVNELSFLYYHFFLNFLFFINKQLRLLVLFKYFWYSSIKSPSCSEFGNSVKLKNFSFKDSESIFRVIFFESTSTRYSDVLLYTTSPLGYVLFLSLPDNVSSKISSSIFTFIPVSSNNSLIAVFFKFSPKSWHPPGNPHLLLSERCWSSISFFSF